MCLFQFIVFQQFVKQRNCNKRKNFISDVQLHSNNTQFPAALRSFHLAQRQQEPPFRKLIFQRFFLICSWLINCTMVDYQRYLSTSPNKVHLLISKRIQSACNQPQYTFITSHGICQILQLRENKIWTGIVHVVCTEGVFGVFRLI